MPKMIMSATIAPSDTSTSTILSPNPSDQIVCAKTPLKMVHDVVFSEPVLPNGTKKKLAMDIQIPAGPGKKPLAQLSLFAVPALAMSLIFKDVDLKGLHYRA